jgi:hypothetical protein
LQRQPKADPLDSIFDDLPEPARKPIKGRPPRQTTVRLSADSLDVGGIIQDATRTVIRQAMNDLGLFEQNITGRAANAEAVMQQDSPAAKTRCLNMLEAIYVRACADLIARRFELAHHLYNRLMVDLHSQHATTLLQWFFPATFAELSQNDRISIHTFARQYLGLMSISSQNEPVNVAAAVHSHMRREITQGRL